MTTPIDNTELSANATGRRSEREFGRIGRWRVARCTYTDVVDAIPTKAMTGNTNSTGSTPSTNSAGQ